jgi:hypothetical protein
MKLASILDLFWSMSQLLYAYIYIPSCFGQCSTGFVLVNVSTVVCIYLHSILFWSMLQLDLFWSMSQMLYAYIYIPSCFGQCFYFGFVLVNVSTVVCIYLHSILFWSMLQLDLFWSMSQLLYAYIYIPSCFGQCFNWICFGQCLNCCMHIFTFHFVLVNALTVICIYLHSISNKLN